MTTPKHPVDYAVLFQSLPGRHIVMAVDDPTFTIIEENAAHEEVAMVKREDIIGRPFFEVFPDTSDYFKEHGVSEIALSFRKVIETGKPDTMEALKYDIRDANGKMMERWWQAIHHPLHDPDGNLIAIFQQTEDITEKVKADARLNETKYQLDEALAIGQIGTWRLDIASNSVTADKNLARMFGIPDEEAAANLSLETFTNSIYIKDRPDVLQAIENAIRTRTPYEKEYRTISRDGSIRTVIARGKVRLNKTGEVETFSGIIFDITERKAAEDNLAFLAKASSALSSSLDYTRSLHTIAHMIVPDIADWCIVNVLDETTQEMKLIALAGKNKSQIQWLKEYGKNHIEEVSDSSHIINKVLLTGESQFYPTITAGQDGFSKELIDTLALSSALCVPLMIRDKIVGTITILSTEQKYYFSDADLSMFEDLARRVSLAMTNTNFLSETRLQLAQLEELRKQLTTANEKLESRVKKRTAQLEETNLNLQRSNQELQDFAYVASHDLQEPLRKIQAFGTILEEEYANELGEGNDYLTRMRSAAARMSTLIEDLLEFSRVTTHAKEFQEISLQTIVSEVLEDLESRIADNDGVVEVGELPVLHADPTQMRQLFQNLIGNALKFHQPGVTPKVIVSAKVSDADHTYEIRVQDNGVGFEEKYLDRIFAVFQRLHSRESYEGTGIGLAVCRKIVERHGGKITAVSSPGKGSTFIITLPTKISKKKVPEGVSK